MFAVLQVLGSDSVVTGRKIFSPNRFSRNFWFGRRPADNNSENVNYSNNDGITTIRLNRPHKKNALSTEMYRTLGHAFKFAGKDPNTKIVVFTGTGEYFCSGTDITENSEEKIPMLVRFVDSLIECYRPIVAVVNGPAIGMGVSCLGLCDVVYATDKAFFQIPSSALSLYPVACSSFTFAQIMGPRRGSELLYFGGKMRAKEAEHVGFVNKVYADEELGPATEKLIEQRGRLPMEALVHSKELVRRNEWRFLKIVNRQEVLRLIRHFRSEKYKQEVEKFRNKRK